MICAQEKVVGLCIMWIHLLECSDSKDNPNSSCWDSYHDELVNRDFKG